MREVGLVESKKHPCLTCSTDHLCVLRVVWTNEDPDYYEPVVCKAKTRATACTVEAEVTVMEAESLHETYHVESQRGHCLPACCGVRLQRTDHT